MPTFILWRTFAPDLTDEDGEMMLVRAVALAHFYPSCCWRRSFDIEGTDPPQGFCVYEGPSKRDLHWQQRLCWLPFDEIREVDEVCSEGAGLARDDLPDGWSHFLVERRFAPGASAEDLGRCNRAAASGDVRWVRSFLDGERGTSACVFAASSAESIRGLVSAGGSKLIRLERLVQGHPADVPGIFDRLGVPHYWEES